MTPPAQVIKKQEYLTARVAAGSQFEIGEIHPLCHPQPAVVRPDVLAPIAAPHHPQHSTDPGSMEKTRAALLALYDRPEDNLAATVLWEENREAIEGEINRHLLLSSHSNLPERILSGLVWHARFFCDEVDDPQAWVARCANLEARRIALELTS